MVAHSHDKQELAIRHMNSACSKICWRCTPTCQPTCLSESKFVGVYVCLSLYLPVCHMGQPIVCTQRQKAQCCCPSIHLSMCVRCSMSAECYGGLPAGGAHVWAPRDGQDHAGQGGGHRMQDHLLQRLVFNPCQQVQVSTITHPFHGVLVGPECNWVTPGVMGVSCCSCGHNDQKATGPFRVPTTGRHKWSLTT